MNTSERSVEETAQSIIDNKLSNPPGSIEWTNKWLKAKIVEALTTERQRCDQELQKARHDWLREEIVKLEGMKQEIPTYLNKRGHHTNSAHRKIKYNQALDEIIHRYQSELDQPTVTNVSASSGTGSGVSDGITRRDMGPITLTQSELDQATV